jgi:parallel beta-helix repeat protein
MMVLGKKLLMTAAIFFSLLIVCPLHFSAAQEPIIRINGDGTVTPSTAPIMRTGSTYVLTANVNEDIIVGINNVVFDGNGYDDIRGVFLINVMNVTIQNCVISTDGAVSLDSASNITIINNTLTGADLPWYETGAISIDSSSFVKIVGNVIANGNSGIIMLDSHDNLITENNITGMSTIWPHESAAIILYRSTNNTFYHNNFINNAHGVMFNGVSSGNILDNGYPNGGNYWSDNSGSQWGDRYPLSSPFTTTSLTPVMNASLSESASALNFGNTVNFTVSVEGGNAPFTYAWYIDGELVENSTSPHYATNSQAVGSHHVYVEVKDADNNTAKTLSPEFNVLPSLTYMPSSSASPTQQPTAEPSQTPYRLQVKDFAPIIIPGSMIFAAIIAVGLLVYLTKRRGSRT